MTYPNGSRSHPREILPLPPLSLPCPLTLPSSFFFLELLKGALRFPPFLLETVLQVLVSLCLSSLFLSFNPLVLLELFSSSVGKDFELEFFSFAL